MFVAKRFAAVDTDECIARRHIAQQFRQCMNVHMLRMARVLEKISALTPLVAHWTPQVARFCRQDLQHRRERESQTSVANCSFELFSPLLKTAMTSQVHATEMNEVG